MLDVQDRRKTTDLKMNDRTILYPESVRPTLKTIAEATGFAVATVSRALKDAPDIGEETKRRVREAAERLGYRQNRAAVRLRTGKTNVIALTLSTEADVMNHTSRLIYSIAEALRGTSYHLVVMPFFPDQERLDQVRYIVETESADGIIMNQTTKDDSRVRYLEDHNFPYATHGRTDMGINHPFFDFDNEEFARIGVRSLIGRGRKDLLLIPPPHEHSYSLHMKTGFADEARKLGVRFDMTNEITSDSIAGEIEDAIRNRIGSGRSFDGIVTGSNTSAMAAVYGAEQAGFALGRDFDLVSKEAIPFLRKFRKEIIVVQEDVGRAGHFLARALMDAIERRAPELGQCLDRPSSVVTDKT
jgi:LacI family transcriptional regulator